MGSYNSEHIARKLQTIGYLRKWNSNLICTIRLITTTARPGCVAQTVEHLTRNSGVLGSIPGLATYFRFSFRLFKKGRRAVVSYWRKYVHEVLVNRLGSLSLPRKSVVKLTDRPDMTFDVYRGRKKKQYININHNSCEKSIFTDRQTDTQ